MQQFLENKEILRPQLSIITRLKDKNNYWKRSTIGLHGEKKLESFFKR